MSRIKICHVVNRFSIGGMENGVVNIINHTPEFDHSVIALTQIDPKFALRINRDDVELLGLDREPGIDARMFKRLFSWMRTHAPTIVHTRNLPAIDLAPLIRLAGVKHVIHSEHGRDVLEPTGDNVKYNRIRRWVSPFVRRYIGVSRDISEWLVDTVGIRSDKVVHICNGVDTNRFAPGLGESGVLPFPTASAYVVGTVGRLETIKAQDVLLEAFIQALRLVDEQHRRMYLAIVGDGSMRASLEQRAKAAGIEDRIWFAGNRADVSSILPFFDLFVLPSDNEGISNTILEAMACGVPVLATDVGGNGELVQHQQTGLLVPKRDHESMAREIARLAQDVEEGRRLGSDAREQAVERYSLAGMIEAYSRLYRGVGG